MVNPDYPGFYGGNYRMSDRRGPPLAQIRKVKDIIDKMRKNARRSSPACGTPQPQWKVYDEEVAVMFRSLSTFHFAQAAEAEKECKAEFQAPGCIRGLPVTIPLFSIN